MVARAGLDAAFVRRMERVVGRAGVFSSREQRRTYDCDGLRSHRTTPGLVVLPETAEQVQQVVRECHRSGIPFVARGSGTGLSGGAQPLEDGLLVVLSRMRRILAVDVPNQRVVAEPGVTNLQVTQEVTGHGSYYAPDPSSQVVCSIGGNVAENSGGAHCLKYGFTTNHVLGLEVVLPDGEMVHLGGPALDTPGYDLVGAFVGSEGCFGVALDVTVRLQRNPQAVRTLLADFMSIDAAARAVSAIIARGILPAALEMMDAPTIRAVEASIYAAGYPIDAEAVLLIELDGFEAGLDDDVATVVSLCTGSGARAVRVARDDAERLRLWQGRKKAFGAMGRLSPHLVVQDAVVPRTKLPAVLEQIHAISSKYRVTVCNVFHAGDGNLHPNIPYDAHDPDESARVHKAMREIMELCIAAGGSITGEHGVGMDKLAYMDQLFTAETLSAMCDLRDVFDPSRRANPGKVVPIHSCREWAMAASAR